MGGLIEQHPIIGHYEIVSTVEAGIIGLNDREVFWIFLRKVIKKVLKVVSSDSIIILNHPLPCQRFNDAIKIKGFKWPLYLDDGFYFFQSHSPSCDRF